MSLFPATFLLGLAGFDPTGAIVIITALAMGVSKRQISLFAITTFIGTVLTGIISSFFVGTGVNYISELLNYIPDSIYMILEFIVSFLLLKWFVERVFCKQKKEDKDEKKEGFFTKYIKKGLFTVGLFFSITALTDPSFLALVTLSGHSSNMIEVVLANSVWILISQSPIFILSVAVMFNKHEQIIQYVQDKLKNSPKIAKIKKCLSVALSVIILLAGLLTLVEGIYFCVTGVWLF